MAADTLEEKLYTSTSYLEGLRCAGIRDFLWEVAAHTDVDMEILDVTKSFLGLRERVYFRLTSPDVEKIDQFKDYIFKAMEFYNRDSSD